MKRYITLAILFFLVFTNCGSDMIVVNPIALKLKKLETKKFINQIEEKEAVLNLIAPIFWEQFSKSNLDFRKSDFQDTWSIYEDSNYIIVTGTVGRSKSDIEFFVIVMNQGNIEYIEIGRDKVGKYPINIIPFSKDDLLN